MPRLTETDGLTDMQQDILRVIRECVDAEIIPVVGELDHSDTYPDQIVAGLRQLEVFGLTTGPEYGVCRAKTCRWALRWCLSWS